ncbi:MAG: hypothetical protein KF871_03920 [Hydrogenophaga sp.]|uniref:hypothetical protein n=1 Tax=Hydrogenophaga sp. TaxID=1904254 RepID=UPI001D8653D1|nr:hypothetical protein [Hydrogenophaga sp.]MBX3609020.1 hypothetical protein [Hydrogenophaga sp.]
MGAAYTVALVGFSQSESATFESFFRLAARRPPAYQVQEEVLDAQVLIVNADNAQAMLLVRGARLPGRILLVGGHDGGTGWPLQPKPIRLVSLLGALDSVVGLRTARATAAAPSPAFAPTEPFKASQLHGLDASMRLASGKARAPAATPMAPAGGKRRRFADTDFPPTRPMTREEAQALDAAAARRAEATKAPAALTPAVARPKTVSIPLRGGATDFADLEDLLNVAPPAPRARNTRAPNTRTAKGGTVPDAPRGDALLVGQSLVEGRILLKRFRKYELAIDWCRDPSQAQAMLDAHPYRLVVIDRLGGAPDAFSICRSAKQSKNGTRAPVVILFAPSAGSMDRMKAGLAGADAYLSRSVSEADLYKVLAHHHLVNLNGFAPTDVGSF